MMTLPLLNIFHRLIGFKRKVKRLKNAREKKVVSQKKEYRKTAKRKVVQTLIKRNKNKPEINNALLKNTSAQGTIDDDDVDIDFKITAPEENDGNNDDED